MLTATATVFCFLLSFLYLGQGALSYEYHINNTNELITFSKNVNNGTSYLGTIVFLDVDIDFSDGLSEQFEPIGMNSNYYFQGTFNGQGHPISNLAINSSSQFAGLFGYSKGTTIRNVVVDSSCSFASSYSSSSPVFIGGVVGYCTDCTIENTVNMGSITFTGNINSKNLFLGGIVGYLYTSNKEAIVKNCANYGSVTHSGTAGSYAELGGIVGGSGGSTLDNALHPELPQLWHNQPQWNNIKQIVHWRYIRVCLEGNKQH